MAISSELKQIYSNYDDSRRFYETVQLYHPTFDTTDVYPRETSYPSDTSYPLDPDYDTFSYFLVRDTENQFLSTRINGMEYPNDISYPSDTSYPMEEDLIEFVSYPFNVIQPQVGEDQQDIGIVLDNVSLELLQNIELASQNQSVPISMTFRVYMQGGGETQITPITLSLTEVVVDMFTVSCKASRVDLFKRKFPFGKNTYYNSNFKGLIV